MFRIHTSVFWGARVEFYLVAENTKTGLLSWVMMDYISDTISYDEKHGLNEMVESPIDVDIKKETSPNDEKQQIEEGDIGVKIDTNEGTKIEKKHQGFSILFVLCIILFFALLSIIWVILSGSIMSYVVMGIVCWLSLCFIIALMKK